MFILKLSVTNLVNVENKFALNIVDDGSNAVISPCTFAISSYPAKL
ncbi:hypothetical protein BN177_240001 [Clostridioides difficile E24]|nr:hypothetical protein [Clostridioides difficile]CCL41235.1 hypothetical protein BN177_240001 [Clostridioides difficile E24]CCL45022.1 hypothetical protein BN178_280031 [Clostridioides difficile T42]